MSLGYIGTNIPSEWEAPLLTDLVTPKQWKTISTKALLEQGYVVYGANGKIGFYNSYTHEYPTIMITCRGATCGSLHISEPFSYINGNAMALDGQRVDLIGLSFLYHALAARGLQDTISGSAQPQITGKGLSEVRLPLPPLAEQKAIAEKLDTLLAQVESTKARLERIPKILKRFRQSVLAAAVSGKLTEEWRGGKEFITNMKELGEAAKFIDYRGKTPKKKEAGIPLITAKNIRQGYISREPREFIAEDDYDSWMTRGIPSFGDVLITTEAPMGYVANIDIEELFALAQRAICLKFDHGISPYYASIYMQSYDFQKALSDNATGSTVKGIKAALLKKIAIVAPSEEEQAEIVRRVDQLLAHADTIETQVSNALERVNNLTQSILAKAFRGELTEQWRKENPDLISGENSAEALLEKIKAERAAAKPVKRGRKKA